MTMRDSPSKKLRLQYKKIMEIALIISLIFHIFLMQGFKKAGEKVAKRETTLATFEVEEIPQTLQEKSAPAPSRPTVPIASEDEDLPEDMTIDDTVLDLDAEPPPPPAPPDETEIIFVPYDEPPEPIGGYPAIQRNLVYPDFAQRAGVEGRVLIYAQVDERGNVVQTRVMKSLGTGCDEAAEKAIRSVKWKPAMQRDTPVKVWIMVPVEFKLTASS
jgi:protein TonB